MKIQVCLHLFEILQEFLILNEGVHRPLIFAIQEAVSGSTFVWISFYKHCIVKNVNILLFFEVTHVFCGNKL